MVTASCATSPPPSPMPPEATQTARAQQRAAEDVVANYIYSQLNADPVYYYRHVDVRVSGDVAILSGYVWDTQAIYRAREIAGQVPGITRVVTSQLELERNGNKGGVTR
jgi:osmotically-inducible protein OsmY